MPALHFQVYGSVQGVGFRYATQCEALRLGLNGWVRNRRDGSVEIHAEGEAEALGRLADWLQHGPATARVSRVEQSEARTEGHGGFLERPTG
ncbi:acylphosphatase [Chitinilyticum litopenaei]|uniref:acylphosphatase n=1 Tax=Chitinilyticum litopenaei TaxID=1121276 RepID=UPI0003FB482D|nr:acylphosphatase [Chitinilyticum litopenaei]